MIAVERFGKDAWKTLSENAHKVVFGAIKPVEMDRVDFALLLVEDTLPLAYIACREHDAESLYWQYGGSFPSARGTPLSWECMLLCLDWVKKAGYKRVTFLVENDNIAMLKMAWKAGFRIFGIRYYKGSILVEHGQEFESGT